MRQKTVSRRHSIEILFPIILFLVFAVQAPGGAVGRGL